MDGSVTKARSRGRFRPHSIVLLVFSAGVLWFMVVALRGGEHPLALEPELVLCDALDPSVWSGLPQAGHNAIIRIPAGTADSPNYCALELDPVTSGDRFERIARGDDANRVRNIATVMVVTRAALFRQHPSGSTADFTQTWSAELRADGLQGATLEGSWRTGELFTGNQGRQGVLIEDDGVMIWITSAGTEPEALVRFAQAVATDLRKEKP